MLRATVSGSFHRHMQEIYAAVGELRSRGVDVLSPSDPRVVDHIGEFLFVASDRLRSIKLVQDRHLAAIRASAFLWVVCPDGYTGASTSMEIGAAYAHGVPVFSTSTASDITLSNYVTKVSNLDEALLRSKALGRPHEERACNLLLHPEESIDLSMAILSDLRPVLSGSIGDGREFAEGKLDAARRSLLETFDID